MKKENLFKFLYAVSALLLVGFALRFGIDIYKYDVYMGSAPLYAYAIIRVVTFLLPSIIFFIVATIIKRKNNR